MELPSLSLNYLLDKCSDFEIIKRNQIQNYKQTFVKFLLACISVPQYFSSVRYQIQQFFMMFKMINYLFFPESCIIVSLPNSEV